MDVGKKRSTGLSKSCVLIIVVASVERFAYKGVASNLVTYLTDVLKLSTSSAAKTVNSWCGVTSMLPLLGAFLADSYWDRYSTILCSSLIYILGLVALTSWALLCTWMPESSLFLPLYLISIAQGGYNPSLQAFGADQLDIEDELPGIKDEERSNKKGLFFQWWYFGICSGSLMGITLMSYIQDTYGWEIGFAIPAIAMGVSFMFFVFGTPLYIQKQIKSNRKPIEEVFQSIKAGAKNMMNSRLKLPEREVDNIELELEEKPFREDFCTSRISNKDAYEADDAPYVTKAILKLLPIWAVLLMFAVIFQLPSTFFTKQGMAMKRNIGKNFMIPPATLQSAITISIILLMPLYDKIIIPFTRIITRDEKGINVLQRIGIGMFLSIIAMVVAALVEGMRLKISKNGVNNSQFQSEQLSIFWLLPQYILLGVSDVFTVVGMQEFFYGQVPSMMRTIGIALYLSVFGVGSFLSAFLISIIELATGSMGKNHGWFSDDIREAQLDNYYWFLALLSTFSFLVFILLCKNYYGGHNALANENHD